MTQLKSIIVSRTLVYSPGEYIEYCESRNQEPTQDGFLKFLEETYTYDEDFGGGYGQTNITLLEYQNKNPHHSLGVIL